MKIGVLSRRPTLYSTRRLVQAAQSRGHEAVVIDYLRCYMNITAMNPRVMYAGEELHFDAIIPRIGASHTFYGTAVVRQFEVMGVFPAVESQSITRSRDKLRSFQLLTRSNIGLPVTGFAHATRDTAGLLESVGGAPVVIKLLEGTQGIGVVLAETHKAAESVIAAFRQLEANLLVQEYIQEANGTDIRVFVVGNEVVASMMRTAAPGEFRSNLHRGGKSEHVDLTDTERRMATESARVLGLNIAGVDLIRSDRGPLVLEVNASPGLEGIEESTGVNVAEAIIKNIEESVPPSGADADVAL